MCPRSRPALGAPKRGVTDDTMQYADDDPWLKYAPGFAPDPYPLSREEEHDGDCEASLDRWRDWLRRRGYLNRTPRDRSFRRHQLVRERRHDRRTVLRAFGAVHDSGRTPPRMPRSRPGGHNGGWEVAGTLRRERMLREQDEADNAA